MKKGREERGANLSVEDDDCFSRGKRGDLFVERIIS